MSVLHVSFEPFGPDACATAAQTELVFLYIPMLASLAKGQDCDATQDNRLATFIKNAREDIPEIQAVTGGWAVEVVKHNRQDTRVFVVLVGWRSEVAYELAVNRMKTQIAFDTLSGRAIDVQKELVAFSVSA